MASLRRKNPLPLSSVNSQGYDGFKGLALKRDILSRACERAFRHTTIGMDFISDKSFNKVVQSASREIIIVLTTD